MGDVGNGVPQKFLGLPLTALWVVCHRLGQQERKMEEAARQIAEYILDRREGGIECNEEGAMYRLFHEVNEFGCGPPVLCGPGRS